MSSLKIVAIVLLVVGALSLAYGGFSYTKSTSEMDFGPVSVEMHERERVNLPVWLGVAFLAVGGGLLVGARQKA